MQAAQAGCGSRVLKPEHAAVSRCGRLGGGPRSHRRLQPASAASAIAPHQELDVEDKFLARNLTQFRGSVSPRLTQLHEACWAAVPSLHMPSTRNEEYRYTDISPLLRSTLEAADKAAEVTAASVAALIPEECVTSHLVLVNGVLRPELSHLPQLPEGAYVGGVEGAPEAVAAQLGAQSAGCGGPFSVINGAAAQDVVVLHLPAGTSLEQPLFVLCLSSSSPPGSTTTLVSAPRLLLHLEVGASLKLVEEHAPLPLASAPPTAHPQPSSPAAAAAAPYFNCSVVEVALEAGAQLSHGYVCREQQGAAHFKATLVKQATDSSYTLTEARVGGGLTRHDVVVQQGGPRTQTHMNHFVLASSNQLHDLHTKLELNHPEGVAKQLHKCIVASASGRGVFDGNVKVNRRAQRSDAGQLSRNLLLANRATVNVKPNLQIIADDVKCTHGCAVSDLSDEELFYFRARGISALAARQALVASFGAEVTQRLALKSLLARVQLDVKQSLGNAGFSAVTSA
ncbi:iron-sulfur cluster assembly protein [Haematococcus lacustris]